MKSDLRSILVETINIEKYKENISPTHKFKYTSLKLVGATG